MNIYNKNKIIKIFKLNEFTNFDENIYNWKKSLVDNTINNQIVNKKEILFEDMDNNNDEEYDKNDIENSNMDLKDIIYNPELYGKNNFNLIKTPPLFEKNKNLFEEN